MANKSKRQPKMKTYAGVITFSKMVKVRAESDEDAYDKVFDTLAGTHQITADLGLELGNWHIIKTD